MHLFSWHRPLAARLNPTRKRRPRPAFRPRVEILEDRTTPTAVQLTNLNFATAPSNLIAVGTTLYFEANDGVHGPQLWRSAGRPGDAVRVASGSQTVDPLNNIYGGRDPAAVGSWLYFFSNNSDGTYTLWRNDSSASPTGGTSPSQAVQTFAADPSAAGPYNLTAVGNDLYYGGWTTASGGAWELWKLAGANAASLSAPPAPVSGPDANGPYDLKAAGSNLYFTADAPGTTNIVLWELNGTTTSTAPVQDTTAHYVAGSLLRSNSAVVGTDLYEITGAAGTLYRVSGLQATQLASVGPPNVNSPFPLQSYFMTAAGGDVYFFTGPGGGYAYALWKSDGTTVSEVWAETPPGGNYPLQLLGVGSDLYFTVFSAGKKDVWKSDGTAGGTELLQRSFTTTIPFALTPVGSSVYFDGPYGQANEIWQSGGTPGTTQSTGIIVSYGSILNAIIGLSSTAPSPADYPSDYWPFAGIGSTLYYSPAAPVQWFGSGDLWRLNNPPVANPDAYPANQDTALTVTAAAGVLANDTDPDAADAGHLTASLVSGPSHGSLTFNADGSFTYTPAVGYVGPDSFTYQASDGFDPSNVATVSLTVNSLQTALNGLGAGGTLTVQTTTPAQAHDLISAANALNPATTPASTLVVDLGGQTIQDTIVNVPPQVTMQFVNGTFIGGSPALTVSSGVVIVKNSVFLNSTDAPTILVKGGSLTLRNDTIQETTGYNDPAIALTGGTLDLGTASSPGWNTINIHGAGAFAHNTTSKPISAIGDTFTVNGLPLTPSTLSGTVFEDFNNDGQIDFGEKGIANVLIRLAGTDDLGNTVSQSQRTNSAGAYVFLNLRPGSYTITETQPAGYAQGIDSVGTAGGSLTATDRFSVPLGVEVNGLNYNYGERPAGTGPVQQGQAATMGFWNNTNGQALILALNGGGTSHQLGDWLAATLVNLYGVNSGNNLVGKNNAYVAALYQSDFAVQGVKLDAQVLATALAVYATNATLDSTGVAAQYGFTVSGDGVGAATWNVGSNGDAFGVANNTTMTVMDLLLATDAQAIKGLLYSGNTTKRNEANAVYSPLTQAGSIS
jgi:ELWxxDGT repeat protein/VCBS repeat-containing protein